MAKIRLVAAMEDQVDAVTQVPGAEDATGQAAVTAQLQVNDDMAEGQELQAAIEDADEGAGDLEALGEVVDGSLAGDAPQGLTEDGAEMLQAAIEPIDHRLGISMGKSVPSLESFGSKSSRIMATRIASESIWDKIKAIWAAIIKGLKTLWAKLKGYYKNLFDAATKLKNRAEGLLKKVNENRGTKSEDKFTNAAVARGFEIGGSFSEANVTTIVGNHKEMVSSINGFMLEADKVIKDVNSAFKEPKTDAELLSLVSTATSALTKAGEVIKCDKDASAFIKEGTDTDEQVFMSEPLLDGRVLTTTVSTGSTNATDKEVEKLTITFKVALQASEKDKEDRSDSDNDVSTADKSVMSNICRGVIDLAKTLIANDGIKSRISAYESSINSLYTKIENSIKKAINDKNATDKDSEQTKNKQFFSFLRALVVQVSSAVNTVTGMIPGMSAKAGNLALNYVSGSLSNYKVA